MKKNKIKENVSTVTLLDKKGLLCFSWVRAQSEIFHLKFQDLTGWEIYVF